MLLRFFFFVDCVGQLAQDVDFPLHALFVCLVGIELVLVVDFESHSVARSIVDGLSNYCISSLPKNPPEGVFGDVCVIKCKLVSTALHPKAEMILSFLLGTFQIVCFLMDCKVINAIM